MITGRYLREGIPGALFVALLLLTPVFVPGINAAHDPATLIWPEDLRYIGAFRVPQGAGEEYGWNYGGGGLAYCPAGDSAGPDDGYPGSLFGVGHDTRNEVCEISIPVPKKSPEKVPSLLNTAGFLQPFTSITSGVFAPSEDGAPLHMDLEYIPARGSQKSPKIYIVWGEHMQFEQACSHAWSETVLSVPRTKGPWRIGNYPNFVTSDYLFSLPDAWADAHTGGLSLVTGRFRDGSLGGSGPALLAIGPWLEGNPPQRGATLRKIVPLLMYEKGYEGSRRVMAGFTNADEWSGGTWLSSGNRSAVAFVGTKGRGRWWYGFSNGIVWPDNPPYPPIPPPPNDDRGWWASGFVTAIAFYDPADLAAAASRKIQPCQPQPYAELVIDRHLYDVSWAKEKRRIGGAAFDPGRRILYIAEFRGDGDRPLIHAWKIRAGPSTHSNPSVAGISPSYGRSGTTTAIWNLAGACFTPGAQVTLSKRGESPVAASAVQVVSGGRIRCRISIPVNTARGLWDVAVRNPDGSNGTILKAFFVM
ncbi:MAG: hypothetical protein LUQ25_09785 [Methanoregulaceae archaeon]|nr:hypothetical protein [Methanoregulaceae archaeon]